VVQSLYSYDDAEEWEGDWCFCRTDALGHLTNNRHSGLEVHSLEVHDSEVHHLTNIPVAALDGVAEGKAGSTHSIHEGWAEEGDGMDVVTLQRSGQQAESQQMVNVMILL
jgi:hypothetical protein